MTDIATTPQITLRRLSLPRPSFPRLAIGRTLDAMNLLIGGALNMAYVDPYTSLRRRQQIVPDDDLDGRDPSW